MLPEQFVLLASYNRWMNEKIYSAAAGLPTEILAHDAGAFFGSIIGTLNHNLVGDIVWLRRFAAHPARFAALQSMHDWPQPPALNHIISSELAELRAMRERLDALISQWCGQLTADDLAGNLSYHSMKGVPACKPFGGVLMHFFNHQTHHRGQLSTLLFQQGVDVGVTDLLMLIDDVRG